MDTNAHRMAAVGAAGIFMSTVLVASVAPPTAADGPAPGSAACRRETVPVTLSPQATTYYTVVGWLCGPAHRPIPTSAVQVLLSGLTYDHHYWDMPHHPGNSYVQAALQHGDVVFSLDRLGVGASSRPPADLVTVGSEAYVTHQIVQALRRGTVAGIRFATVYGVGHSMGAAIWICEAALWRDVNALVVSSYLHQPNIPQQQAIAATLYAAGADPAFATRPPPDGYVTTVPGSRLADFYFAPSADSAVVAADEAYKQTATAGERASLNLARDPMYSGAIDVPVLLLVGEYDSLGCDPAHGLMCTDAATICGRESPYYPAAPLAAMVVPDAGHSVALHRDAMPWLGAAEAWVAGLSTITSAHARRRSAAYVRSRWC
jgi:pimeloyl-ACP methyl ester carboxylesterase